MKIGRPAGRARVKRKVAVRRKSVTNEGQTAGGVAVLEQKRPLDGHLAADGEGRYRFSGHQTFPLRLSWLPKAIRLIEGGQDPLVNIDLGITELGLGKNMVEALRCWIEAFGVAKLINGKWKLSEIGRTLFDPKEGLDPYLDDHSTAWVLHWSIATSMEKPFFAWECLFNRWNAPDFTRSQVMKLFNSEAEKSERPQTEVTLNQHLDVFLHSYCSRREDRGEDHLDCVLAQLKLITSDDWAVAIGDTKRETLYRFDLSFKRSISRQLFAFFLHDWWNRNAPKDNTVSLGMILNGTGSPGRVLRMTEREIYQRVVNLSAVKNPSFAIVESSNMRQIKRLKNSNGLPELAEAYEAPDYE